jgi:hypothetical protein
MTITPKSRKTALNYGISLKRIAFREADFETNNLPIYYIYSGITSFDNTTTCLVVAGYKGLELGYEYFIVLDEDSSIGVYTVFGYYYTSIYTIGTKSMHILYCTLEQGQQIGRYYKCSKTVTLLDGETFLM